MENALRMQCPGTDMPKSERIGWLFEGIARWIRSQELADALALFGGTLPPALTLKGEISYLNDFAEIWDYRAAQGKGCERWSIDGKALCESKAREIMRIASGLGLVGTTQPLISPSYILPLGGARMANLTRAQYASQVSRGLQGSAHKVVALGGMRPINSIERPFVDSYAPNAQTEFAALCVGMEKAFCLEGKPFEEEVYEAANMNLSWAIRRYAPQGPYVVAAPSPTPARRANSLDTFDFFVEKFGVGGNDKVLLVTSCIYVPYQFLRFMGIALERNLMIDCVGTPNTPGKSTLEPAHYLQEIKATINAMKALADEYL